MNIICNREALQEALRSVTSVVPVRSTKPILENVHMTAAGGVLELAATDLEITIRTSLDVGIEEEGEVVVPARRLADSVRNLASEKVQLQWIAKTESWMAEGDDAGSEAGFLELKGEEENAEMVGADRSEFPVLPDFDDAGSFEMPGACLADLVRHTAFAAGKEGGRYVMNGILFGVEKDVVRLVATDGRRLAMACSKAETGSVDDESSKIVPSRAFQHVAQLVGDSDDPVSVHVGSNQVAFRSGSHRVFTRILEGDFPKYQDVIPEGAEIRLVVDAGTLAQRLRFVTTQLADDARGVRFQLSTGVLGLETLARGWGQGHAKMEVEYAGEDFEITFNADYLLDGLKVANGDVEFCLTGPQAPGRINLGDDHVYVVMPMNA